MHISHWYLSLYYTSIDAGDNFDVNAVKIGVTAESMTIVNPIDEIFISLGVNVDVNIKKK